MKIVILAGGSGKRLWPISRVTNPKQFQPLFGDKTLLQETYLRVVKGFKTKDIYISTGHDQLPAVKKDLAGKISANHFFVEPIKRDTSGAIGLASALIAHDDPNAIIATVNSDQYVKNVSEYTKVMKAAEQTIKKYPDHLLLIGVNPTYPETGYGYIKLKKAIDKVSNYEIFSVAEFKEKPNLKVAQKYLRSKSYLWNPAFFVFRVSTMLELYKKHLPADYKILSSIKNNPKVLNREFPKLTKISIDYGIIERAEKKLCLPAKFDWVDVGHFRTVKEIFSKSSNDNLVKGSYMTLDGTGNLIYGQPNKLIATIGIKNSIVVDTGDVVLVCDLARAQDIKKLVEEVERQRQDKFL